MTILIAITGGSGSGKSTLAEALISSLPEGVAALLREDLLSGRGVRAGLRRRDA